MHRAHSDLMLRRVLWVDAATCVASGAALLAFGGILESWLAIPAGLSRIAGVFLLFFAALVAWTVTRPEPPRAAAWTIVIANAAWAAASIVALVAGWLAPNGLGTAFVVAQAIAVAVIAEVQVIGLRRIPAAAA